MPAHASRPFSTGGFALPPTACRLCGRRLRAGGATPGRCGSLWGLTERGRARLRLRPTASLTTESTEPTTIEAAPPPTAPVAVEAPQAVPADPPPEAATAFAEDEAGDSMEALLAEQGREPLNPQRGDVIEGVVVHWSGSALIVDVGAKSEGAVLPEEMRSLDASDHEQLKTGDLVHVFVTDSEAEGGTLELSIDRARGEQGWHELQRRHDAGEVFDGRVTGSNKGGLLVNVEGVNAFVPLSQIVGITGDREQAIAQLGEYEGRSLRFKVIEINRRRNRVILSERAAVQEWRAEQKDRLLDELHEGEIRAGRITSIRPFGVFVDLGGADGLAHLSELSWERDVDPEQMFTIGQEVNVYITKIDKESKKIGLSIRRASPEQWDEVVAKFEVGQLVPSTVTKLVTFGAFARIEGPVEGLVHVSELADRRITHPREVVNDGDVIPVKIVRIERDRHRLGLSLRQARTDAERAGWMFDSEGRIARLPDDLAAELGIEQGEAPPPPPQAEEPAPSGGRPAPEPQLPEPTTAMEEALQRAGVTERDFEANVGSASAPATDAPTSADSGATEAPDADAASATATDTPAAAASDAPSDPPGDAASDEATVASEPPNDPPAEGAAEAAADSPSE